MNISSISDLRPAGLELFDTSESFLKDLSEADEALIAGGGRSNSNSGKARRKRRRKRKARRRARRIVNRSNSVSRS